MYMVRDEVTENANRYLQFLVDSSHHELMYYMNLYVFNKMYNTDFGNLVPLVLANVLHINIAIISKDMHGYNVWVIHTNASTDTLGNILVYKTPDHYDSIISKTVTTGNNSKCCDKYKRIGVSHTGRHHAPVTDSPRLYEKADFLTAQYYPDCHVPLVAFLWCVTIRQVLLYRPTGQLTSTNIVKLALVMNRLLILVLFSTNSL